MKRLLDAWLLKSRLGQFEYHIKLKIPQTKLLITKKPICVGFLIS